MPYITSAILGVGLAMDAFAASVSGGMSNVGGKIKHALITALSYGLFQAVMTFIGYCTGSYFSKYIAAFDHWVAFILLTYIGVRTIVSSVRDKDKSNVYIFSFKLLFITSIATSIDALAAGVLVVCRVDVPRKLHRAGRHRVGEPAGARSRGGRGSGRGAGGAFVRVQRLRKARRRRAVRPSGRGTRHGHLGSPPLPGMRAGRLRARRRLDAAHGGGRAGGRHRHRRRFCLGVGLRRHRLRAETLCGEPVHFEPRPHPRRTRRPHRHEHVRHLRRRLPRRHRHTGRARSGRARACRADGRAARPHAARVGQKTAGTPDPDVFLRRKTSPALRETRVPA